MLTRDQLLAAHTPPSETVSLPTIGGEVVVRGFTAGQLTSFQKFAQGKKGTVDEDTFAAKLIVRTMVDAEGKRILKDEDWSAVQDWPGADFQKVISVSMRLCGYSASAEGNS
jgi:hypothetical protein